MTRDRLFAGVCIDPAGQYIDACITSGAGRGQRLRLRDAKHLRVDVDASLQERIQLACEPRRFNVRTALSLDEDIGQAMGKALDELLKNHHDRNRICAGVEGIHVGGDERAIGVELGSGAHVARVAGVRAVGRFTESDYSAGGVGGPIRAWANWLQLRDRRLSRVSVDIGVLVELTFVPAGSLSADVVAMYTGGGLSVLNILARRLFSRPADQDGGIASSGAVCKELLNELLANPYFLKPAPKITNSQSWGDIYVQRLMLAANRLGCGGNDIMTTATELVARSVAQAVLGLTERPHQVVLSGDGAMNIHLASRIRTLLSPCSTITCEKFDVGILARRAHALCAMSAARVQSVPIYCPHATGAKRPVLLGAIYDPPGI